VTRHYNVSEAQILVVRASNAAREAPKERSVSLLADLKFRTHNRRPTLGIFYRRVRLSVAQSYVTN